jgi:hypothetical protein
MLHHRVGRTRRLGKFASGTSTGSVVTMMLTWTPRVLTMKCKLKVTRRLMLLTRRKFCPLCIVLLLSENATALVHKTFMTIGVAWPISC